MCKKIEIKNGQFPGIYKITENLTGRVYIGQTARSINERLSQHIYTPAPNSDIDKAIQEKGVDAFTFEVEVPMKNPTTEQLWFQEYWYISKYDSFNNGFNKTHGNRKGEFEACLKSDFICVGENLFKDIIREYNLDFRGKRILLINNFDESIKNYLRFESGRENVDIIYESFDIDEKDALGEFIKDKVRDMKKTKVDLINGITKVEKEHYDIIISNPPYGKIGNEITQCIVDNIDFGCFINLLPANDYRRNKQNALWQYVDINSMRIFQPGSFKDAYVTTMACKINKERAYYISEDEFEIQNYSDKILSKYFYENRKRKHYAITDAGFPSFEQFDKTEIEKSFYIGHRDPKSCHLPYSLNSITTRYNMNAITKEQVIAQSSEYRHNQGYVGDFHLITFDTENEKNNLVKFVYSDDGFRFMSKLFTALNVDSSIAVDKYFPKVDWHKSWTVESLLKNFGYTEDEIEEVMADLPNYKLPERE